VNVAIVLTGLITSSGAGAANIDILKTQLESETASSSCISALPLARKIYALDSQHILSLQTIVRCTLNNQDINHYALGAKEMFEQSKILSIVPQLLEIAQVKDLVPILKEVEVKKDKTLNDYLMLNELYERLGDPEKQLSALNHAIELSPGDPRPLLLLAAKKFSLGTRDEALTLFKEYLSHARPHPGQIYLTTYVLALLNPLLSSLLLLLVIWGLGSILVYGRQNSAIESYELRISISTILFFIPGVLAFRFWQTGKALPFGGLLLILGLELFYLLRPYLRRLYQPLFKAVGQVIYFVFNGTILAMKIDRLPSGSRVFIAILTLATLGMIVPTIEIPDVRYALTIFCAFLFYSTLGSFLIGFLRSRTSLLSSMRWIAIAATLPFLVSYLFSNWNSLGVPLFYARLPSAAAMDSLFNYIVFWGVSLVLSLHLGKIIAETLILPIQEIIQKVSLIEKGKFDAKVDVVSKDEIGTLGNAINRMGSGLERRERVEKLFHKYIDKKIANRILENCETEFRIESSKVNAVILFADIRGYTSLSETIPAQDVVMILNQYFEKMVRIVQEHGGVVDKFIGDNLMAVWGVPYEVQDGEEKAVRAALQMIDEIRIWNEERIRLEQPSFAIGIGLNAGVVIAGSLGSAEHMEYTVIGDVVNTAQRAEAIAGRNEVLISESIYRKLSPLLNASALEPLKVKGKELPQLYWAVSSIEKPLGHTG
jgi:class 3 adenylate cyclase/tetratricopeptide (TPR) repeat protein